MLYPEALGGANLLPSMQAAARGGLIFPLISMSDAGLQGDVYGLWVIRNLDNVAAQRWSVGWSGRPARPVGWTAVAAVRPAAARGSAVHPLGLVRQH